VSGRTIGTIAGAAIGFSLGLGPLGMQLATVGGGILGGLVDPETLQGATFSGRAIGGSQSGLARAIAFGTITVDGRLLDGETTPRKGKRKERQGKGGPVVEHDTALLNYSIEICESSELRGTSIHHILAVWEDEKLVYDVRPGSAISSADNAKWLSNKTFHLGREGQAPSAMLEAIHGVGNVPAYVGTARMDVVDEDMVLHGERLPQRRFLVSACAEAPGEPELPPGAIACGIPTEYSGGETYPTEVPVYLGPNKGYVKLLFGTGENPDKFEVWLDGEMVADSGYRGDPDFPRLGPDGALTMGYYFDKWFTDQALTPPPIVLFNGPGDGTGLVETNPGVMVEEFLKTTDTEWATVKVYGPLSGTLWSFRLLCPDNDADGYGGAPIPDADGYYIDPITGETSGPDLTETTGCTLTLEEVCRRIYRIGARQLEDSHFALTALAGITVRGYKVQDLGLTAADAIEPLRRVWQFDLPEYDGQIHARLRGGAIDHVIDTADIIPTEESTLEAKRGQDVEYPRKLHLHYIAPSLDYKATMQTAEDDNPDTFTVSEESVNTYLVLSDDEAKQAADIILKVMRNEREHELTFALPIEYVGMVAADLLNVEGKRYRVDAMRLERNRVVVERAVYDRAGAFTSTAVGAPGTAPPAPGPRLRGPTDLVLLNLPVLKDADDKPGIYWPVRGYPNTAWTGATLQLLRGSEWVTVDETTTASNMGALLADLPEHDGTIDYTNALEMRLSEDMDTITTDAWFSEGNPVAVVYANGTAEILQPRVVVEDPDGEYTGTEIIRGRLDTVNGAHVTGDRVVALDSTVRFVQLRKDDIGKTLTFRAVSLGTDPDAATTQTITLGTLESQREWQPYDVEYAVDEECATVVTFVGRHRLGTDANPVPSQWFVGWRVDFHVTGQGVRSRMTTEQTFTYTPEMQEADWAGRVFCEGFNLVTVTAVNEYTGGDGSGGTGLPDGTGAPNTGDPMTDPDTSKPWYEQGALLTHGWYDGEPLFVWADGRDDFVFKGSEVAPVNVGGICRGVSAANLSSSGSGTNGMMVKGVARAAATHVAALRHVSDIADAEPHKGYITDSITFAAKPTYSLPNWMGKGESWNIGLVDTNPPGSTCRIQGLGAGGSMESRAEFDSGKPRGEFTVTGTTGGGQVLLGIVAAHPGTPGDPGTVVASFLRGAPGDDTYCVEVNADVSPATITIRNSAGATIHSGTLALPVGRVFRFRWYGQKYGITIKANFGNESWVIAPAGGTAGLPNMATVIGVGWDGLTNTSYQISANGSYGPQYAASGVLTAGGVGLLLGDTGQNSGRKRVRFVVPYGRTNEQVGLCLASHTGPLGTSGTSIGYRTAGIVDTIPDRVHRLTWTWDGGGSAELPVGFDTSNEGLIAGATSAPIFVYDEPNATMEVWIHEMGNRGIWGTPRLWIAIPNVPADTYWPALFTDADGGGSAEVRYTATHPTDATDWTETR
jgi:hypothetical protein